MLKHFLAMALASAATYSHAQDVLLYSLKVDNQAIELHTVLGSSGTTQSVGTDFVVVEVNSNLGAVENVVSKVQTGLQAEVTATGIDQSGRVDTVVRFTSWDKGLPVAKGSHVVKVASGESVVLPAAGGKKVTLGLRASANQ